MNSNVTADELRAIPLFEGASEATLQRLATGCGELVSSAGRSSRWREIGIGMFVILEGTASVEWRGGTVDLPAGTFFGSSRSCAGRQTECARAGGDGDALPRHPRDVALDVIESEPSVALAMLREVARRFASLFRTTTSATGR
jgi:CRP-like cAMP-binding protein